MSILTIRFAGEAPSLPRRPDARAREEEVGDGPGAREEEDEEDPGERRGDAEVPRHGVDERRDVERDDGEGEDLGEAHAAAPHLRPGERRAPRGNLPGNRNGRPRAAGVRR